MKGKKESCEYCGKKIEPKTTRAKFCSEKCRVYFWREKKTPSVQIKDATKPTNTPPEPTKKPPATNYSINTNIPPAPERKDFPDNWAYLEAKAEWKEKYIK
jgi:hypothetical protein